MINLNLPSNFTEDFSKNFIPNTDATTLITLAILSFIVGFVTFVVFFYFSNKNKIWEKMDWSQKIIFSFVFGSLSIFSITLIFVSLSLIKNMENVINSVNNGFGITISSMLILYLFLRKNYNEKGKNEKNSFKKTLKYSIYFLYITIFILLGIIFIINKKYLALAILIIFFIFLCFKETKNPKLF